MNICVYVYGMKWMTHIQIWVITISCIFVYIDGLWRALDKWRRQKKKNKFLYEYEYITYVYLYIGRRCVFNCHATATYPTSGWVSRRLMLRIQLRKTRSVRQRKLQFVRYILKFMRFVGCAVSSKLWNDSLDIYQLSKLFRGVWWREREILDFWIVWRTLGSTQPTTLQLLDE